MINPCKSGHGHMDGGSVFSAINTTCGGKCVEMTKPNVFTFVLTQNVMGLFVVDIVNHASIRNHNRRIDSSSLKCALLSMQ